MTAKELRQLSYDAVSNELDAIHAQMVKASKGGALKIFVKDISDAAQQNLSENGFKVKIVLPSDRVPDGEVNNKWSISW